MKEHPNSYSFLLTTKKNLHGKKRSEKSVSGQQPSHQKHHIVLRFLVVLFRPTQQRQIILFTNNPHTLFGGGSDFCHTHIGTGNQKIGFPGD